jgi:hypothetical protein
MIVNESNRTRTAKANVNLLNVFLVLQTGDSLVNNPKSIVSDVIRVDIRAGCIKAVENL